VTCGAAECRRKRKQYTDGCWWEAHPEYGRERYQAMAADKRSRKTYRRRYRKAHPEYLRRNLDHVRAWRARRRFRRQNRGAVSSTRAVLRVRLAWKTGVLRIASVSSTSRDVFVSLSE
jgi:hypothetical protein